MKRMIYKANSELGLILDEEKAIKLVETGEFSKTPLCKITKTKEVSDMEYERLLSNATAIEAEIIEPQEVVKKAVKKVAKKKAAKKAAKKKVKDA